MAENRRQHLMMIGAVGIASALPLPAEEAHPGPHYHAPVVPPFSPRFFSAAEGLAISRLADLIIPATDTPGAVAAGVPHYIDARVAESAVEQRRFREGLDWLDGRAKSEHGKQFMELTEDQQVAILTPLSEAADKNQMEGEGVAFFWALKGLTTDGYYTSYAGLVQELGYQGNQMLRKFEGCAHEDHGSPKPSIRA